jgi:hypothetical protein
VTAKIVKAELAKDNNTLRSALDVFNLMPGQWASLAEVPPAYYTPLKDLLFPNGATQQEFEDALIEVYGIGATPEDVGIHIITLPFDSVMKSDSNRADQTGAEYATLKILSMVGENLTDDDKDLAEQIDLRVRLILDINCRKILRKNGYPSMLPALPATADKTVVNNIKQFPVIVSWLGFIDNESAIGKASLYKLEYYRVVV